MQNMFRVKLRRIILTAYLLFSLISTVYGAGHLTAPGKINISMARIGEIYNFKKIYGSYYEVTNYVQDGLKIGIEPIIPSRNEVVPKEFEPIPDISWVRLEREKFNLKYGEKASTDFFLSIPDNPEYLGKRYQFNFRVYGIDYPQPFSLTTQIFLTISEERVSASELIDELGLGELKFELTPHKCLISNFPLGKRIDLSEFTGESFQLTNQTEQKYAFSLTVSSSTESSPLEISKYALGNTDFFSLDMGEVIIEPHASKRFHPSLLIPDEETYQDKGFAFIIKAQVLGQIPEQNRFSIITVKTGGK